MADTRPFRQVLAALAPDLRGLLDMPDETPEQAVVRQQRERDDEAARARAEAIDARDARQRILVCQRVPARAAALIAAERVRETPAVKEARAFMAQSRRRLLFLSGDPDAGKTTAAAVALDMEIAAWVRGVGWRASCPALVKVSLLQGAWQYFDPTKNRSQPVDIHTGMNKHLLFTCQMLVLDDAGQEAPAHNEVVGFALDSIITERCDRGLRTIVTTNDGPDPGHFLGRYPARAQHIGERLTEHGTWARCSSLGLRRDSVKGRARGEETTP